MWTYKYICVAPSLGLFQRGNLQRVCVSAVMAQALSCPISQECLFALVKLPLKTVIRALTADMHIVKGKLIGVSDSDGTQGTHGVPLDLHHLGSDPLTRWRLGHYLLWYAKGIFGLCLYTLTCHSNLTGG